MTRTDSTVDPDPDREALAAGYPPRAVLLARTSLAACAARGMPRLHAWHGLAAVPPGLVGNALGRHQEAADNGAERPAIRIPLASPALTRRDRWRPRVPSGPHSRLHGHAPVLDREPSATPDDAGERGRFGRYPRRAEGRELFGAHRVRRLPYRSPAGRGSVEGRFAARFVGFGARPTLLRKGGQPVVRAREAAFRG